jgi:thiamine-monophosphate kinase
MSGHSRGEDALHNFFADVFPPQSGVVGPGDDCAQLQLGQDGYLQWTCDQLVEGVHVEHGTAPEVQARKLLRRTISDLAAAGAEPWLLSWTAALPANRPASWLRALAEAFVAEAQQWGCAIAGGDLSNTPAEGSTVLTCTAIGRSHQAAPGRSQAQVGDHILVSGRLGGSVKSGRHLLPEPRIALGRHLCSQYRPTAMMDISDGLAKDLPRMLAASGVGAEVELSHLPMHSPLTANVNGWRQALGEGEDYELLLCLPSEYAHAALVDPVMNTVGLTIVGTIVPGSELRWLENGKVLDLVVDGWEHAWPDDA